MNPYLQIIRPNVCILSVLGILIGSVITGYYGFLIIPAVIAAFLITAFGNTINDYFDFEIDKINASHRPLPSGKITRKGALYYSILLVLLGIAFSAINIYFLGIAIFNAIVSFIYAWKLKKTALAGNAAVAYLAASTYVAAAFISAATIPFAIIVLSVISFMGTLSREIVKDIEDVEGDKSQGACTLPIIAGRMNARILSHIIMIAAIISLYLPYHYGIYGYEYLIIAAIGGIVAAYSLVNTPTKAQKLIKISMYIVLVGFLVGSLA